MDSDTSEAAYRQHSYHHSGASEGTGKTYVTNEHGIVPSNSVSPTLSPATSLEDFGNSQPVDSNVVRDEKVTGNGFTPLSLSEIEILKTQLEVPAIKVGYRSLYRYATKYDLCIIAVSSVCAITSGAVLPLMTVIFGQLSGVYQDYFFGISTRSQFNARLAGYVLYFVYLAVAEFVTIYLSIVGFAYTGEHISRKIREQYLAACLRQNIAFFDLLGAGEITTRITANISLIQDGISEKVGLTLTAVSAFVTAFVIGFVKFWKLTLILTSTVFAITLIMAIASKFVVKYTTKSLLVYAIGGTVAEEVLSSIRNATAFGTQEKLARQYDKYLTEAEKWGFKVKLTFGVMIGSISLVMYLNYGLAFWQGAHFLVNSETNLSSILTILLAIMIGAFSLANVAPTMQAFTVAVSAAASIYSTIDRVSPIDAFSDTGKKLEQVHGCIEFQKVKHIYPSRLHVTVLDDFSLRIPAGKKTALVGASGSGKSTIVGLIERFYDPVSGHIILDGHDIRSLNLRWLRQQVSVVSQEPTLFATTIFENIKHGLTGTRLEEEDDERQRELVIEAAKTANAHDFITSLPESYETNVGQRGFLLSGGQKQRIAIARAIISDPKVLLLDEATSSLDTKSEGVVQAALEAAAAGRTTIAIAHRLSTIKDADSIVVMADGRIIEQGSHDELLQRRGAYYKLVQAQKFVEMEEEVTEEMTESDAEEEMLALELLAVAELAEKNYGFESKRPISVQTVLQQQVDPPDKTYSLWTLIKVIASFNVKEWKLMLLGLFFCIIGGAGNPIQTLFFAEQITILSVPVLPYTADLIISAINFWCLMYLMLAFVLFIAYVLQGAAFAYCSERLVHRVRSQAFRVLLRQDITFFDKPEHSTGALVSFLSTETAKMAGLSGTTLGTILTMLTTLIAALALSITIGWKLALVTASTIPVLLISGFLQFWILAQFQGRSQKAFQASAGFACEAIAAIRTVASLAREADVLNVYRAALAAQSVRNMRSVLVSSVLYAASQSLTFLCMALGFWYGGTLIADGEYNIFQTFVCFPAIIFGAQSAGSIFSFARKWI